MAVLLSGGDGDDDARTWATLLASLRSVSAARAENSLTAIVRSARYGCNLRRVGGSASSTPDGSNAV